MSILSLQNAYLKVADHQLLAGASLQIQPRDRIALVGRNGAGKSSLLRVLQGELVLDAGQLQQLSGLKIASLGQEVPVQVEDSVYSILVQGMGELGAVLHAYQTQLSEGGEISLSLHEQMDDLQAWDKLAQVEIMASHLGVDAHAVMSHLSGGMKRRVLLAAALLANSDVLLLDEPTNHLDMAAIEWLEAYLKSYSGSLVLVTHDRTFLSQVCDKIVEMDRGELHLHLCDYETYLDRREAMRLAKEKQQALFDKKLAEEEVWIRTGIQARRTRNEGRVRALKALRKEHQARREELGKVKSLSLDVRQSGKLVLEATQLQYQLQDRVLLKDFSLLVTKGDKLGIIGPNGCGKTTLIRLLLGELQPDSGAVRQGSNLQVAYFDQLRRQLDENKSLMYNVAEGADYVTIAGKQKHVASYLGDFLFASERYNQPVSTLSGGERNRLMLAKLFAKPVNLLVMDEPTNDLDIETLELLESMLMDYPGTLILISHDRSFINAVVTSVLVYESPGVFSEWVGGYDDYKLQKKQQVEVSSKTTKLTTVAEVSNKLTYKEQKELAALPGQIETLEAKIADCHRQMGEADFYQQDPTVITGFTKQLAADEALLTEYYARWEALDAKE